MTDWNTIEEKINQEIIFLKNNFSTSPYSQNDHIQCPDCLYRQIAILIIGGKIKLTKINCSTSIFKNNKTEQNPSKRKEHGSFWHDTLIKDFALYFTNNGYKTTFEPSLNFGRADLGVDELNLFLEIGTINLYKLYINLLNLRDCKIALIPCDEYILKFSL